MPADQIAEGEASAASYTYEDTSLAAAGGQEIVESFTDRSAYEARLAGLTAAIAIGAADRVEIEAPMAPFLDADMKLTVTDDDATTFDILIDSVKHSMTASGARTSLTGVVVA